MEKIVDSRLTHSRIQAAKTCLRKHELLYEYGLRPLLDAQPLRMGSAFHDGLDLVSKCVTPEGRQQAITKALGVYDRAVPVGEDESHAWLVERETVSSLLVGHNWRWEASNADMTTILVEEPFEIRIVNPNTNRSSRTWTYCGKIDRIATLPSGRLAIVEYKTTSKDISPDGPYWPRLLLDSQISYYWLAAVAGGLDVETVIYDVTHKPQNRPLHIPMLDEDGLKVVQTDVGERAFLKNGKPRQSADKKLGHTLLTRIEHPTEFGARVWADIGCRPDFYYQRREIPRLRSDLQDARGELWAYGCILRHCQLNRYWPRNTAACEGMFGRCVCWGLCTGGFDPATDEVPENWKQVEDVHPELKMKEVEVDGTTRQDADAAPANGG